MKKLACTDLTWGKTVNFIVSLTKSVKLIRNNRRQATPKTKACHLRRFFRLYYCDRSLSVCCISTRSFYWMMLYAGLEFVVYASMPSLSELIESTLVLKIATDSSVLESTDSKVAFIQSICVMLSRRLLKLEFSWLNLNFSLRLIRFPGSFLWLLFANVGSMSG